MAQALALWGNFRFPFAQRQALFILKMLSGEIGRQCPVTRGIRLWDANENGAMTSMKKGGEHGLRSPPNDFQTAVKLGQAIGECPSFRSISLIPV
jgi:hypothetical protein